MKRAIVLSFLVLCLVSVAFAADDQSMPSVPPEGSAPGGQSSQREMKAPPQAAQDACSGKTEGSVCSTVGPMGTESGVCEYTPDKKYFACKPDSMKNAQPPKKPSQETPVAAE